MPLEDLKGPKKATQDDVDSLRPRYNNKRSFEDNFKDWYKNYSKVTRLNPDPDDPRHYYDYRGWFKSLNDDWDRNRPQVDPSDGFIHGSSKFKADNHPNRYVAHEGNLYDTKEERFIGIW